jgi:hypothetical protein
LNKYAVISFVLFVPILLSNTVLANQQAPIMKAVDRSWDFFKTIPCTKLDNIKVYSEAEATLLERRRQVCLKEMSVFLPTPIDPH